MNRSGRITSSSREEILFVIKWGILSGCIICALESVINIFRLITFYIPIPYIWYAERFAAWPFGMIPGFLFAVLAMAFRRTAVEINRDYVCIRRIGKKQVLSIQNFAEPSVVKKSFSVSAFQFTILKVYLLFYEKQETKPYRLFEFTEKDLERVIKEIRIQQAAGLPVEEKIHMQDSFAHRTEDSSEDVFYLPSDVLISREKETLRKTGMIELGLAAVLLILFLYTCIIDHEFNWELLVALTAMVLMLITMPFRISALSKKRKLCAERIVLDGSHIWIRSNGYSFSGITAVCLTSPRKSSNSITPVQYYMTVTQNSERRKYWLGSQSSFGDYNKLCKRLEEAMIMYPGKLSYKR